MKKLPILSFLLLPFMSIGQSADPFTGHFTYSQQLLSIPNSQGPAAGVYLSYSANIAVEQPASEVGLGWQLAAGAAVARNVHQTPDDLYNNMRYHAEDKDFQSTSGILHGGTADFYSTQYKADTNTFRFPAYDNYSVAAPGLSGGLEPKLMDFESTHLGDYDSLGISDIDFNKAHFIMRGDFAGSLNTHYDAPLDTGTAVKVPDHGNAYGGAIDNQSRRLHSAQYVEHFFNSELNSATPAGLLFPPGFNRSATPGPGIGAFRITNSHGITYHFSLPVYIKSMLNGQYPLNNDYSLRDYSNLATMTEGNNYLLKDANSQVAAYKESTAYAYQWLLVAITGPDYQDLNNNHTADAGDAGYWVSYDWKRWNASFVSRTPYEGHYRDYSMDKSTETPLVAADAASKNTGKSASFSEVEKEMYYLNAIRTASHSAVFVRDIRLDEHSRPAASKHVPQLKTSQILLFRNEELAALPIPGAISNPDTNYWKLDAAPAIGLYHQDWFNSYESSIKVVCLQAVVFDQDYSLAKNYYNNKHVQLNGVDFQNTQKEVFESVSSTNPNQSGKLTLNSISSYGPGYQSTGPSTDFDYDHNNPANNPNYRSDAQDYWGFYKPDVTDKGLIGYVSNTSKEVVDAWALRRMISPLGGTIQMEYEANRYNRIFTEDGQGSGPIYLYPIETAGTTGSTANAANWDISFEDQATEIWNQINTAQSSGADVIVCIPFTPKSTCPFWSTDDEYSYAFGTATFDAANSRISNIANLVIVGIDKDGQPVTSHKGPASAYTCNTANGFQYTGGGYVMIRYPEGSHTAYGGGHRLKRIQVKSTEGEVYEKVYEYGSGVAPSPADRFGLPTLEHDKIQDPQLGNNRYYHRIRSYGNPHLFAAGIGYSSSTERYLGRINQDEGAISYQFLTSEAGIANFSTRIVNNKSYPMDYNTPADPCYTKHSTATLIEVTDAFSARWGLPLSTKVMDVHGNPLSITKNEYTDSYESGTHHGQLMEYFNFRRTIPTGNTLPTQCSYKHKDLICIRKTLPTLLKKQISVSGNTEQVTEYLAFDPITGAANHSRSTGTNQSEVTTESTPAYTLNAYATMGPKSVNASYSNQLHATAETITRKDPGLTGANAFSSYQVKTFGKQVAIRKYDSSTGSWETDRSANNSRHWRGLGSYSWKSAFASTGLFNGPLSSSEQFDHSNPTANVASWKAAPITSLYNEKSQALETRSEQISGQPRYTAQKMGYNDRYVTAQASPANYASLMYSGFEDPSTSHSDYFGGEVRFKNGSFSLAGEQRVNGSVSGVEAHTGGAFLEVPANSYGCLYQTGYQSSDPESGLLRGQSYRVSVWMHQGSPEAATLQVQLKGSRNGTAYAASYSASKSSNNLLQAGEWLLLQMDVPVPEDFETNGADDALSVLLHNGDSNQKAWFDDLRFHPAEASMSSQVYDSQTGRLQATLNEHNLATRYHYDASGAVLEVWQEYPDQGFRLVEKKTYHYGKQ